MAQGSARFDVPKIKIKNNFVENIIYKTKNNGMCNLKRSGTFKKVLFLIPTAIFHKDLTEALDFLTFLKNFCVLMLKTCRQTHLFSNAHHSA